MLFEPEGKKVSVSAGTTIFDAAKDAGVGVRSECGGKGLCGKCRVIVKDSKALSDLTEIERRFLQTSEVESGYRLACQARILNDVKVIIPPESRVMFRKIQVVGMERPVRLNPAVKKFHITLPMPTLSDIRPDHDRLLDTLSSVMKIDNSEMEMDYEIYKRLPDIIRSSSFDVTVTIWDNRRIISVEPGNTSNELFGFAVDIGTSKIVGYLVNLTTGEVLDVESVENPQIMYGEDIMSRITFAIAKPENLEILQKLVVDEINKIINEACRKTGISPQRIYEVVVVGNTAMHHFLLGIQPKYVALSPYVPAVKKQINVKAKELHVNINSFGIVTVLPIVAGFVGADAVADVLATGIHESDVLSLLVDIGTNTEVFLGNSEDLLSCSCASGPAFEGMHIKHGMKAVTGAIERVSISSNFEVKYKTVGNTRPTGLCGSAMIDAIAEMFKRGIINDKGSFNLQIKTSRLRKSDGEVEFVIAWGHETATGKDITLTQHDIREIQLAKAAIFTGCSILMKRKNVDEEKIDRVLVAGAFGNYINPESAKVLGLLPDVPIKKIKFVGNTAIAGAKMALTSKEARKEANEISKKIRYLELAACPDFKEEFLNAIFIPHKNLNRFPSVRRFQIKGNSKYLI
ncbi:MAG: ASKHA domain-containing protein [archaeon GB-1867-005]|nr:ASKHA domain-containing protein [Candidatus Culexmicrobium cathedralense]